MVGRVIGKNGETIKALQTYTGSLIQVNQVEDPCQITVSGTPQSISLSTSMVTDIVNGSFKGFALLRQLAAGTAAGVQPAVPAGPAKVRNAANAAAVATVAAELAELSTTSTTTAAVAAATGPMKAITQQHTQQLQSDHQRLVQLPQLPQQQQHRMPFLIASLASSSSSTAATAAVNNNVIAITTTAAMQPAVYAPGYGLIPTYPKTSSTLSSRQMFLPIPPAGILAVDEVNEVAAAKDESMVNNKDSSMISRTSSALSSSNSKITGSAPSVPSTVYDSVAATPSRPARRPAAAITASTTTSSVTSASSAGHHDYVWLWDRPHHLHHQSGMNNVVLHPTAVVSTAQTSVHHPVLPVHPAGASSSATPLATPALTLIELQQQVQQLESSGYWH
ncbi:hypothetical protein CEUSTIGMA_g11760.t1 [Chlamydomonas eustigma]|uniref:K Homology domain-containing protein n=1 Tax=Chlamydomonas eustigma TaxID=1157962 RepID=A0A250XMN7_9CHLO|nr:hypothetical protein CEUSTIGMA_g11760.t1 [Chlamydomonas eustigma]|eukprot:GAX84338.1 hypothetical protein CEUSTIGMA_g11760.t1 [Chlamydomonas eustigma]